MVKKISFHISVDGEVALSVDGAQGSSCESLTAPFENVIGSVASKTYKDSFYQETALTAEYETGLGVGGNPSGKEPS